MAEPNIKGPRDESITAYKLAYTLAHCACTNFNSGSVLVLPCSQLTCRSSCAGGTADPPLAPASA